MDREIYHSSPGQNMLNYAKKITGKFYAVDLISKTVLFVDWSLGLQEDFSDIVKEHNSKITWVVGDRDEKYCEVAESLKSKNILLDFKKVSSGHRLWLDHSEAVANILKISIKMLA